MAGSNVTSPEASAVLSKIAYYMGLTGLLMNFFALLMAFVLSLYAGLGILFGTTILISFGLISANNAQKFNVSDAKNTKLIVTIALIINMLLWIAAVVVMR
jgi:accessory gene regulator protein AgrB